MSRSRMCPDDKFICKMSVSPAARRRSADRRVNKLRRDINWTFPLMSKGNNTEWDVLWFYSSKFGYFLSNECSKQQQHKDHFSRYVFLYQIFNIYNTFFNNSVKTFLLSSTLFLYNIYNNNLSQYTSQSKTNQFYWLYVKAFYLNNRLFDHNSILYILVM